MDRRYGLGGTACRAHGRGCGAWSTFFAFIPKDYLAARVGTNHARPRLESPRHRRVKQVVHWRVVVARRVLEVQGQPRARLYGKRPERSEYDLGCGWFHFLTAGKGGGGSGSWVGGDSGGGGGGGGGGGDRGGGDGIDRPSLQALWIGEAIVIISEGVGVACSCRLQASGA